MGDILSAIKSRARELARSASPGELFAGVDSVLLRNAADEIRGLLRKHGSADALARAVLNRSQATSEGVVSTWLLSALGLHFTVKLAKAIRDRRSPLAALIRMPDPDIHPFKFTAHLLLVCIAVIYLTAYTVLSSGNGKSIYLRTPDGRIMEFEYRWSGPHDYVLKDHKGNTARVVWLGGDRYEAVCGGRTTQVRVNTDSVGDRFFMNQMVFLGPDGKPVLTEIALSEDNGAFTVDGEPVRRPVIHRADLTRVLGGGGPEPSGAGMERVRQIERGEREIQRRQGEIRRRVREIDSISREIDGDAGQGPIYIKESVAQAKKILREAGLDYQALTRTPRDQWHNLSLPERRFMEVREELERSNSLGYLGVFAKVLAKEAGQRHRTTEDPSAITRIHRLLVELEPVIKNLRDSSGNRTTLFDLPGVEQMEDALVRLGDWRRVNAFMRRLPPRQKALVWPDGYWPPELADSSQFLVESVIKISKSEDMSRTLLSKISAVRSAGQFLREVSRVVKSEPWTFDHWLAKLRRTPGVAVTWHSRERGQIICLVVSWWSIKRIAYMTNWCIVRSWVHFRSYTDDGLQFVLYDFSRPAASNDSVIGFTLGPFRQGAPLSKDPLHIKHCHLKDDKRAILPSEFTDPDRMRVRPEFVDVSVRNLGPANLLVPGVTMQLISQKLEPLRRILRKPIISRFLDFWA